MTTNKIVQVDFNTEQHREIKIHPVFKKLIPPLEEEEFLGLEKNILKNGCEQPLQIWNGYIIDGHNRYEICNKHDIKFRTEEKNFASEDLAKVWMIDHQLDRRNLATYARGDLIMEKQDILFPPKHGNRYTFDKEVDDEEDEECKEISRGVRFLTPVESDKSKCPTRQAAKAAGMSHDTYNKIKYLRENADEETKENLRIGKTSINREYDTMRGALKGQYAITAGFPIDKDYDIFYCDPFSRNALKGSGWEYDPGMYLLSTLPVKDVQNHQAKLFLWCPPSFIEKSLKLMKEWGFEYLDSMCWELDEPFEERVFRVKYLLVLVGTKGLRKDPPFGTESFIKNKGTGSRHDQVRDLIDEMYPEGNKLEITSKATPKGAWDAYTADKEGKFEKNHRN